MQNFEFSNPNVGLGSKVYQCVKLLQLQLHSWLQKIVQNIDFGRKMTALEHFYENGFQTRNLPAGLPLAASDACCDLLAVCLKPSWDLVLLWSPAGAGECFLRGKAVGREGVERDEGN